MARPRSLSGIKPTGQPHLGNLLGMILPALKLQENYDCFYFIANYHALTTSRDAKALKDDVLVMAATFLAFGLDTNKNVLYRQSDLPEVTELAWILSCLTPQGLLERSHAYKDAKARNQEINHGLFAYPVLMAADILLFDSQVVPVGKDQKQHVEMARDIAQKVNQVYGDDTLVIPEPLIKNEVKTISGLDGQKMSKSYNNTIEIFEEPKALRKKVMKITTDSTPVEEPKDPQNCNVFNLYKLLASPEKQQKLSDRYQQGGMGYGEAKQELFEELDSFLKEPREKFHQWMSRPEDLEECLTQGATQARLVAKPILERVRDRVGLGSKKT